MRNRANGQTATRCAIYTRKSSEEGLEQDFNSLDAQHESCEALPRIWPISCDAVRRSAPANQRPCLTSRSWF